MPALLVLSGRKVVRGTLRSLIRTAGITVDEFCEQL